MIYYHRLPSQGEGRGPSVLWRTFNMRISNLSWSALFVLILVSMAPAEEWPHWRGAQRSGIVREDSGWKAGKWPVAAALWGKNVGKGGTSTLVAGGRLYSMGYAEGKDTVYCLDATTGKEVWSVQYDCPQYGRFKTGDEGLYSGPSSTPEFDAETGYLNTLSTDGDLNCWDTKDKGRKVWRRNLYDQFDVQQRPKIGRQGLRDYGYTSSPLVQGDALLVEVGSKAGNLVAFARKTGKQLWTSENKDMAGHNAGPVPISVEGVPCVATLTLRHLLVTRLDPGHEGKTVAEYPWETDFANNIASPAVHENSVLITSAYNHGAICKLKIALTGATKVWETPHPSKICTPVIHKGHVYWSWRTLQCLDWETGKLQWEGGKFGDAGSCIVTADGRLIVWGGSGKLALVDTADHSPKSYHELASQDGLAATDVWPHVVLSGGRLYLKDWHGNIKCYSLEQ